MFRNRSLQVKMVKDDKKTATPYDHDMEYTKFEDKVTAISDAIKSNVKKTIVVSVGAVIAYVAADTVRQVAVELAKKD